MVDKANALGAVEFAPILAGARNCPASRNVEIAHHLPGRLRLRSPSPKGDVRAGGKAQ